MQSILWLLLVFHIFVLIFESSYADSHSKWKRRNLNSHKNVIDEMTPGQYSHLQEEIKYNRIPLRHARPRFTKMDMVVSKYTENGGSFGKREDPDQGTHSDAAVTAREKPNAEYLESKLKSGQRMHPREQYFEDGLVIEDMVDYASTHPSSSQLQDTGRRKRIVEPEYSAASKVKMETAGTREGVNQLFKETYKLPLPATIAKEDLTKRAKDHANRMKEATRCKIPTPVTIIVADVYPNSRNTYIPPCTKLNRCAKESGCCTERRSCRPFKSENVSLPFKIHIIEPGGRQREIYEELTFRNDTECKCLSDMMADDKNNSLTNLEAEQQDEPIDECSCPVPFSKKQIAEGESCSCDCSADDIRCLKYKRGEGFMNTRDKKCIDLGQCTKPTCEYGEYLMKSGKCPKNTHYKRFHLV